MEYIKIEATRKGYSPAAAENRYASAVENL